MKQKESVLLRSVFKKKPALKTLYDDIQEDLNLVEEQLESIARSPNKLIAEVGSYLFQQKGKRIRPALLVLCSRLYNYQGDEHILISAVIETIHTASIIHDDIIDKSTLRRGRQSVHDIWGPNITVLLGDYLYIKSIGLALKSKHRKIIQILADTSARMIEGEINEYYMSGNLDMSEADYIDIIDKKTASLFSASCRVGGVLGNAPAEEEQSLADYGAKIGISFQIIDDLLDYSGDEKVLGKPVLADLREGRVTLPLIYTLQNDGRNNRNRIKEIIKKGPIKRESQEEILKIFRSNGALNYTFEKAKEYSSTSKEIISKIPESVHRDALYQFSDIILTRTK